ncbi:multidrug resistance protein SMR [Paenibacillus sp. BIHB 4019]|uniref:Multidrug resistance protein SMR n=1 Tax=Paenibacillus sp. BIHB 4019 TaxID=1870819 RepID=A0A1B2DRA0_9BACL|nr:multidrug efflux SMR transporter [Paenibacillus sp. BIHB 4019]ANY70228.1 multidrug resistance protein SMR [Paenibacillus sp. BIHB 4019]
MAWIYLIFAGLFEVVGVIGMNLITRQKNAKSFIIFIVGLAMSFTLLSFAMQSLPMGTAYAIWTGIGTVGSGLVGIWFYGESKNWQRILFMGMVLSAAVGLKLFT